MMYLFFLSGKKYTKIIKSQAEFDSLTIAENDRIKLNGEFIGKIDIDQNNVRIDGGAIYGSEDISSLTWTDEGANVWSAPMATDPKWINIDNVNIKLAQSNEFSLTGTTSTNQINITHSDVSGFSSIIGSYIVFIDRQYSYSNRFTIIDYNGAGLATLDRDRSPYISSGDKYRLYNNEEYFSTFTEWIWRDSAVKIYSTVDPSTLNITKTTHDYGIKSTATNTTIKNVTFKNQYHYSIWGLSDGLSVTNCNISWVRGQGIYAPKQISNISFVNNTISNIGHNGIWCGPINTISINSNTITNIGTGFNIGWDNSRFTVLSQTDGTGIKFNVDLDNLTHDASNITIENNTIDNTAYNGISVAIGRTGSVKRNKVSNPCQILEDGAAIYFFHYRNTSVPLDNFVIEENFISEVPLGTVFAIYMDNRSKSNTLRYNVIDGGQLMINADTESHNVHHNTVYSNDSRALWFRNWAAPSKIYANDKNLINYNILVVNKSTIYPLQFSDSVNPYENGGSGDNNYYINPYGTVILNDGSNKTLAQLQGTYSQDANSTSHTNYITAPGDPDNEILLITNPTDSEISGSAPAGSWYDVDGNLTTNYTVSAWSSLLLLKDLI